ncbi:MAG: ATP-binding protein [Anaerolineales bacterium]|nr:ATP-binding protein [Anaerolineales bacterium]
MAPVLYVLIGVQGAGKSTWAAANAARLKAEVVASDAIRNELESAGRPAEGRGDEVFAVLVERVAAGLAAGRNVIADATHVRRAWRQATLAVAQAQHARRVAVWFDLPLEVSLARNAQRPGGSWGHRRVEAGEIRQLWRETEPPGADEFDEIVIVR